MADSTRKTRQRKPEPLYEGDGIRIRPTPSVNMERTGQIIWKDGGWFLVTMWDGPRDDDGDFQTVWIQLKPGS